MSVNLSTSTLTGIEEVSVFPVSEVKLTAAQIIKLTRTLKRRHAYGNDCWGRRSHRQDREHMARFNLANGGNNLVDLTGIIFPLNQHTSTIVNGGIGNDIDHRLRRCRGSTDAFDELNGNGWQ